LSNPQSLTPRPSSSDQIGVEEIRRRVDAAIIDIETLPLLSDPPADGKRPGIRDLARLVRLRLNKDVLEAIEYEWLIRYVRRVQRLKRNRIRYVRRVQRLKRNRPNKIKSLTTDH